MHGEYLRVCTDGMLYFLSPDYTGYYLFSFNQLSPWGASSAGFHTPVRYFMNVGTLGFAIVIAVVPAAAVI